MTSTSKKDPMSEATTTTAKSARARKARGTSAESPTPKAGYTTDANGGLWIPLAEVLPWDKNPRDNDAAVPRVGASIVRFGFVAPVCLWPTRNRMVAGHTRVKALRSLLEADPTFTPKGAPGPGLVKVVFHDFATEDDANAYALADNRLNELAVWDDGLVKEQLAKMVASDRVVVGFEEPKVEPVEEPTLPSAEANVRGHKRTLKSGLQLVYRIIVECADEGQQAALMEQFEAQGLTCKPIIS